MWVRCDCITGLETCSIYLGIANYIDFSINVQYLLNTIFSSKFNGLTAIQLLPEVSESMKEFSGRGQCQHFYLAGYVLVPLLAMCFTSFISYMDFCPSQCCQ